MRACGEAADPNEPGVTAAHPEIECPLAGLVKNANVFLAAASSEACDGAGIDVDVTATVCHGLAELIPKFVDVASSAPSELARFGAQVSAAPNAPLVCPVRPRTWRESISACVWAPDTRAACQFVNVVLRTQPVNDAPRPPFCS